ncbi:MAG TPA: transcriptional regulator GcvA [Polyangiaceae bacterium]|nr:transcriptional regulator GcvA [Polyangiaceae bacterium]
MYPGLPRPLSLPSLHGLCVFEAAARHLSFTEASREIGISQTAVSHQIRALETELAVSLFRRLPRRVELTEEGKAWALELGEIFSRLHALNRRLRQPPRPRVREVAVSVLPSFGSRWLVPRLGKFLDRHADTELRLSSSERLVDLAAEGVDIGIRYGFGRYPGLVTEKLADDAWVVVAAPSLLAKRSLKTPRDLAAHVLLQDDSPEAWSRWFAANGVRETPSARRNELTDSSMLIEAAVQGQGIGLARWSLALDELARGRLVLPFPKIRALPTGLGYYLAAPRESLRRAAVAAFREWIRAEAETLRRGRP